MNSAIRFTSAVLLTVGLLFLYSCDKDKDKLPNQIIINGKTVALSHGYISDGGINEDDNGKQGRVFGIILTSHGLELNDDDDLVGNGDLLYIELFSTSSTNLANGNYKVEIDEYLTGTSFALCIEKYVPATEDYDKLYFVKSGSVQISQAGSGYKISFDFIMEDDGGGTDITVKGSFEGLLKEGDF